MQKAPEKLETEILFYAAEMIEIQEESDTLEPFLNCLPFAGLILLLKDCLEGYRISLKPMVRI